MIDSNLGRDTGYPDWGFRVSKVNPGLRHNRFLQNPFHFMSSYHSERNNYELATYTVLSSVKSTEQDTTRLEILYWGIIMFYFVYEILVSYCKSTSQESRQGLSLERSMWITSCYWELVNQLFTFLVKIFLFHSLLHNVYQLFTFL
jgi:hypothetical protein